MPRRDYLGARRGTAALWASVNPVLDEGEIGAETDTHRFKIGDGVTPWADLAYVSATFDLEDVPVQQLRDTDANLSALETPLLSGQFGYGQTTGKTVIGDGVSNFDELPDLRKQFQNVVTVCKDGPKGSADFICSEYDSDNECIQAAIDYCAAHSIKELNINTGNYTPSNQIVITSDLRIHCDNHTVFNWAVENKYMIQCSGEIDSVVLGTTDISSGSNIVNIADVSSISAGDLVLIYDDTIWNPIEPSPYTSLKTGELHEVESVTSDTNTIALYDRTLHSFTVMNNLSVKIIHPIRVELSNFTINGFDEHSSSMLLGLTYCKNSYVYNCRLDKGAAHSIAVINSYNTSIFNNNITHASNSTTGYGVVVGNSSAHVKIHNNDISKCKHCIACGGDYTIGQPRDVRVYNNDLSKAGTIVDAHQCVESIYVYNNVIHAADATNAIVQSGSKYTKVYGNEIYDGGGITTRGSTQEIVYIVINNTFRRCGSIFYDMPGSTLKLVVVAHNHVFDSSTYMINTTHADRVLILHNSVNVATLSGIYLANVKDGIVSENIIAYTQRTGITLLDSIGVRVSNNEIINCCQIAAAGELYEAGIAIRGNSNNLAIENNTITDSTAKMRRGIREYGTADNNTIKNNIVSGATVAQITKLGANTKVSQNDGYPTENTGTATISASATSIVVNHGLVAAPTKYFAFPSANLGNCWIDTVTTTQMTIHCSIAPEADTPVSWSAQV